MPHVISGNQNALGDSSKPPCGRRVVRIEGWAAFIDDPVVYPQRSRVILRKFPVFKGAQWAGDIEAYEYRSDAVILEKESANGGGEAAKAVKLHRPFGLAWLRAAHTAPRHLDNAREEYQDLERGCRWSSPPDCHQACRLGDRATIRVRDSPRITAVPVGTGPCEAEATRGGLEDGAASQVDESAVGIVPVGVATRKAAHVAEPSDREGRPGEQLRLGLGCDDSGHDSDDSY